MGYDMFIREEGYGDGYFRLNIWGMANCREFMYERGMIFNADGLPPWPSSDSADYPDEQAWRKAQDEVLAWHGPEIPGIPAHKFASNDGWIVLPAECAAAAKIGRASSAPEGVDYWDEWLDYLERAAQHGGFEVH